MLLKALKKVYFFNSDYNLYTAEMLQRKQCRDRQKGYSPSDH